VVRAYVLVHVEVDAVKLREAHEVGADEDAQLPALLLAAVALAGLALVLHAHPQLVHLDKIDQHKLDGVGHGAELLVRGRHVGQAVLGHLREVVAEEQAARRVLHAAAHLHHVHQDLLGRRLLRLNVHGTHCTHRSRIATASQTHRQSAPAQRTRLGT
jgi:hypothetical protein